MKPIIFGLLSLMYSSAYAQCDAAKLVAGHLKTIIFESVIGESFEPASSIKTGVLTLPDQSQDVLFTLKAVRKIWIGRLHVNTSCEIDQLPQSEAMTELK